MKSAPGRVIALCALCLLLGTQTLPAVGLEFDMPGSEQAAGPEARQARPEMLDTALQLLLVTVENWQSTPGILRRYERADAAAPWAPVGKATPVGLGKNGLGWGGRYAPKARGNEPLKTEGDGKAPAGAFRLPLVFTYASENVRTAMPVLQIRKDLVCVDDPQSLHYNSIVSKNSGTPDWRSAEKMLRKDGLYRLGVLVAYNAAPAEPGAGSCIFLHVQRRWHAPTSGCTAMAPNALRELIRWLNPAGRPVLVQLPQDALLRLCASWKLPLP